MSVRTAVTLILLFTQVIAVAAMLAAPYLAPRGVLFGVPVPPGFRSTEIARRALRRYRVWIAIPAAAGFLGISLFPRSPINVGTVLVEAIVGVAAFLAQNRDLKPFAIQPVPVRQITLEPEEPTPWFLWVGIIPLLALAGSAVYLNSHWDQIPLRYPVHFDINGRPNGWSDRSVRGVYGPLIFGAEFTLFLFGMAVAGWYGSRRSDSMRKPMAIVMLVVEMTLALVFGLIPLQATGLLPVPLFLIALAPLLLPLAAVVYAVRQSNKPRDPVDPTPNECWKGGMIYYNPDDAALFVQRRDSMGFTINMGNRWSWVLYGALLAVIASGPLVLRVLPN